MKKKFTAAGLVPMSVPAGPFIHSCCQYLNLYGHELAALLGIDYTPNRPALHRMLSHLQGWRRSWVSSAARQFATHYACESSALEKFLIGAGPAPNPACAAAAAYEFHAAAQLVSLFVSPAGLLNCGSIVSVSTGIPAMLLPEAPRRKYFDALRLVTLQRDQGRLDGVAELAEGQHESLMTTFPSNHHFMIDRVSLSAMLRRRPPFHNFDDGDLIDVLGFLVHDICRGGRGKISFSSFARATYGASANDDSLCPDSAIGALSESWSRAAVVSFLVSATCPDQAKAL